MGKWLEVNGEAIYGTRLYSKKLQDGVYYTKKDDKVYAIINRFPFGNVTLDLVDYNEEITAKLLSHDAKIEVTSDNGKTKLTFPAINPDEVKCEYMFAIELANVK